MQSSLTDRNETKLFNKLKLVFQIKNNFFKILLINYSFWMFYYESNSACQLYNIIIHVKHIMVYSSMFKCIIILWILYK